MKKLIDWYKEKEDKIRLISTIISGIFLIPALVGTIIEYTNSTSNLPFDFNYFAFIAIVLCGLPIVVGAIVGIIRDHDITADVLVSLALIGALILKDWFSAGEVAFIMQIGSILEDYTANKAHSGIEKLIKLTPKNARIVKNDIETIVPIDEIKIGDVISVIAGETIPVDGVIMDGETSIDQSIITGESLPIDKAKGDTVISGTINQFGTFTYRALKEGKDSSLQRMIKLAKEADENKAKLVKKSNVWATWLVVVAFSVAVITTLVVSLLNNDFWVGFERGVTVLVVFCPCAFVLATPTAIVAGIGNLTKKGIIIKSGEGLERIGECRRVAFDKTGTLTKGALKVIGIESLTYSSDELLKIVASIEKKSEHPLGIAIVKEHIDSHLYDVDNFKVLPGSGVEGYVNGKKYVIGKFLKKDNPLYEKTESYLNKSFTVVYVSEDGNCIGLIALADTIREDAKRMIEELKKLNLKPMLLTGDNESAARYIAFLVGIDDVKANLLPEDKMKIVKSYEDNGESVCMFGDGVNDSIALRSAHAGVAMGGIGSDIAIESSDAILVNDELSAIPYLFKMSKKTIKKIHINIIIGLCINAVAVCCSAFGLLNPWQAAIVHNIGSVFVVINSLLLLFYKDKK